MHDCLCARLGNVWRALDARTQVSHGLPKLMGFSRLGPLRGVCVIGDVEVFGEAPVDRDRDERLACVT